MPDWEKYRGLLYEMLGVTPLDSSTWNGTGVQVLYEPTFRPDRLVTVVGDEASGGIVEMAVLLKGRVEAMRRIGVQNLPEEVPRAARYEADIGIDRYRELMRDLRVIEFTPSPDEKGRDGIDVSGRIRDGTRDVAFAKWCPGPGTGESRVAARLLLEAARWFPSERPELIAMAASLNVPWVDPAD